jgi:hypothetical protein
MSDLDSLLAAVDERIAELKAAKPLTDEELVEAIEQIRADKAAGIVRPPHPDSYAARKAAGTITPQEEAEYEKLVEAIIAYQERHRERERDAVRPHAHIELQADLVAVETVPTSEAPTDTLRPRRSWEPPAKVYNPDAPDEPGPPLGAWGDGDPSKPPEGVSRLSVEVYGPEQASALARQAQRPGESDRAFKARCARGRDAAAVAERWARQAREASDPQSRGGGWLGRLGRR